MSETIKEIIFDEKTKANLVKISTELQQLQNQATLIIQTIANMNGFEKYEVQKDLSGIFIPNDEETEPAE